MSSIRETIVAWLFEKLKDELPDADVRRVRRRPVDKESPASVSIELTGEQVTDNDLDGQVETTAALRVVVAAMTDCGDTAIDDAVAAVHRALLKDDSCGGHADDGGLTYTGCSWDYEESGDGLAVTAEMAFEVTFTHSLSDMATA